MRFFALVSALLSLSFLSVDSFARANEPAAPASATEDTPAALGQFEIPGPRRSFLRMAGISQKIAADEVFPLLTRNIFMEGYEAHTHPTEFLILLRRYVVQARELSELASKTDGVLRASNCDEAQALLHILGYRVRPTCGSPSTTLLTDDPERAFLAIDSGFPLPALERALQGGPAFEYPYASEAVPVLFADSDWTQLSSKNMKESSRDLLDTVLYDPDVARLYWALSRLDPETAHSLKKDVGLGKLLPYAAVLDFYGRELTITNGNVSVPGGQRSENAWRELVGASPSSPSSFVPKLLGKDKGWLAAYFDVLSRSGGKQQEFFTDPHRLKYFYSGLRAPDPSNAATRGSFRPAPWMLLLVTRLHLDNAGQPIVPGNLDEWNDILFHGHHEALVKKWGKQEPGLKDSDQLLKALFALSRSPDEFTPLQMYLSISELDSRRYPDHRLGPMTVRLLARRFEDYSAQYRIFSEFPELDDQAITAFLQTAHGLSAVPMGDRGNAFGLFQANVSIWQILARQGQIPREQLNDSMQALVRPFTSLRDGSHLYDAGRASLAEIFRASTGSAIISQDKIIDLMAGPRQTTQAGREMHHETSAKLRSVLDDQRLVSLDALINVGDALRDKQRGKQPADYIVSLAGQTKEFQMPRPIFTNGEHEEFAGGVYNNHHTDVQMKTDLPGVLKSRNASQRQIDEALAHLSYFLRDTLVGLNYAYYEPPGAQAIHNNPLLVRSHDFAGETVAGVKNLWQPPSLFAAGSPAGGGAHFVGSLADLPYALADLEQDFISPQSVQALIWKEVAPQLLASAILPRWWNVTQDELHAVALCQRSGEELMNASANNADLRDKVISILSARLLPQRSRQLERLLRTGQTSEALAQMTPSDTFYLAIEFREHYPDRLAGIGPETEEFERLTREQPEQVSLARLAHDFGTPHPATAQNYGLELLNMLPMPPFSGEANRFLAESWDSPNLYWARLADERGYSPVMLNHMAPELTRLMVERIFATDFEDWPALLRAMQEAGNDFRTGKTTSPVTMNVERP